MEDRYVRETYFKMTITTRGATMGLSNTVENVYFNVDAVSALGADNKNFLGKPAVVKLQLYIGDMVPVEAIHMHYSIDLYLREFWYDYRLILPLNKSEQFPLNGQFLDDIWTPDIYFPSGKKGKLHDITRPNSLIRIFPNGEICSSQRVSVTSFCPMNLTNFPFDKQLCEFILEPYSYNDKQCKLEWSFAGGGPIFKPDDLMMFEFTLYDIKFTNRSMDYGLFGMYDSLSVHFYLRRNINYYILQNYFPTALIVVLSWVGFWIDYRSTPARVALGITTVLTITTLANSIRATLPPVSYSKSIDYYLLACFLFVFAALVEFAVVGITDIKWRKLSKPKGRRGKKKKIRNDDIIEEAREDEKHLGGNGIETGLGEKEPNAKSSTGVRSQISFVSCVSLARASSMSDNVGPRDNPAFQDDGNFNEAHSTSNSERGQKGLRNGAERCEFDVESSTEGAYNQATPVTNGNPEIRNRTKKMSVGVSAVVKAKQFAQQLAEKHRKGSDIHMIDKLCRYVFPLTFFIFNAIYFAIVLTQ